MKDVEVKCNELSSVTVKLQGYCGEVEVTAIQWPNEEGFDVSVGDKQVISIHSEEWRAIRAAAAILGF